MTKQPSGFIPTAEKVIFQDGVRNATPRKGVQAEGNGPANQVEEHEPILPPDGPANNCPRRHIVDIKEAVAAKLALPVLDETKRRMYLAWLRGVNLRELRNNYRDPVHGTPRLRPLEEVIREEARRENSELRRFLQGQREQRKAA